MREGADEAETESEHSSHQFSQQSQELDSGSENDGGGEQSGSQGSRRRKRKRKSAGPIRRSCLTILYHRANDVFNQQTRQYEQCADGGLDEQQRDSDSVDGIDQLSQRVQGELQLQRSLPMTASQQHTLRFPFPRTGAAHCGQ